MSNGPHYTAAEDDIIRRHYPNTRTSDIQRDFMPRRSVKAIRLRAFNLGVEKDRDMIDFGIRDNESVIGHLTETERGYLAGIIDGEGCIHLALRERKSGGHLCVLQVSISSTSRKLVEWLTEKFPSCSYECAQIPKMSTHGMRKQSWKWVLSGTRKCKIFLREIAPYLLIKREQAEAAASYRNSMTQGERKLIYLSIREMKNVA